MKVFEVIEHPDFESMSQPTDRAHVKHMADVHRQLLYKRNALIFDRLEKLMKGGNVIIGAFPSEYDDDFAYPAGTPYPVEDHPDEFEAFKVYNPIFYDGEMKLGEPYDGAHEVWYVRKNNPQLVQFVKQALHQFELNDRQLHRLNKVYSDDL